MKTFIYFGFAALLSVSTATTANRQAAMTCCNILAGKLPDKVILPNATEAYTDINNDRWSETAILQPSCIVLPASADDVSIAIKTLAHSGSESRSACHFALKSGGHNPYAGFNNIDCGVSVDLRNINQITVARDRTYVSLGSGARWSNVYAVLDGLGLAIPGAECSNTGAGGVILGGGISYFMPRVGFVADNIIN